MLFTDVLKKNPLTSCQKRLWIEWKKEPDSCAYNAIFHFSLIGNVDEANIKKSLKNMTLNHEALRTHFTEEEGVPYQVTLPKCEVKLIKFDLTNFPKRERGLKAKRILDERLMIPFDLIKTPLYRYILIKIEKNKYILGLSWHHIIIDASSVTMLLKEFSYLYNCYVQNIESTTQRRLYKLNDILLDEKNQFTQDNLQYKASYWIRKLFKAELCVPLPQNKIPKGENRKSVRIASKLNKHLTMSLLKLAGQTKTTPFVILAATLKTLLYIYTKQEDISIGYLINTRNKISNDQIGFFINNLPLRSKLSQEIRFIDLITSLSHQRNNDRLYQNIPL
ncbi:MAG: hypothetical protein EKK64_02995, partial [Neisseriaceae bacterium]